MLCQFLLHSKVSQSDIYIQPHFFQIAFPGRSLQSIEQSSLCYTVDLPLLSNPLKIFFHFHFMLLTSSFPSNLSLSVFSPGSTGPRSLHLLLSQWILFFPHSSMYPISSHLIFPCCVNICFMSSSIFALWLSLIEEIHLFFS